MGKGKDLPSIDFHAILSKRDPALAERLVREGIDTQTPDPKPPTLSVVAAMTPTVSNDDKTNSTNAQTAPSRKASRRGLVSRADGQEAGRITVYVPPELALRLRAYCFEHDLTMTDVAGETLIDALERRLSRH